MKETALRSSQEEEKKKKNLLGVFVTVLLQGDEHPILSTSEVEIYIYIIFPPPNLAG